MPSVPNRNRCLLKLRSACDLSRRDFALLVGTAPKIIGDVEDGHADLTLALAKKISAATGTCPRALMQKDGVPKTLEGRIYTATSFRHWNASRRVEVVIDDDGGGDPVTHDISEELHQKAIQFDRENAAQAVSILLEAAAREGCFADAQAEILDTVWEILSERHLKDEFSRLAAEKGARCNLGYVRRYSRQDRKAKLRRLTHQPFPTNAPHSFTLPSWGDPMRGGAG